MRRSQSQRAPEGLGRIPSPRKHAGERRRRSRIRALRPPAAPAIDRRAALSRVLALWPHEVDDLSAAGRRHVVANLKRALRAERRRGIAGHWTYDLARHVALHRLYRQELTALGEASARPPTVRGSQASIK